MPICEHGHDHNIFVTEDTHDCRNCGVCAEIEARAPPTNEDLLDRLIEAVLQEAEVDGLPYLNRGGDLPDVQVVVPERKDRKLRKRMSDIMREWVREIFPRTNRGEEK
jgi:hypothetical protein